MFLLARNAVLVVRQCIFGCRRELGRYGRYGKRRCLLGWPEAETVEDSLGMLGELGMLICTALHGAQGSHRLEHMFTAGRGGRFAHPFSTLQ